MGNPIITFSGVDFITCASAHTISFLFDKIELAVVNCLAVLLLIGVCFGSIFSEIRKIQNFIGNVV